MDADVPRYLMTITTDVCGLLGAMTLQCVPVLKRLMLAVSVSSRFTQDQLEVYKQSFIWIILVFSQEQLVCVTFFMLLFSKLTVQYYNLHQLFHALNHRFIT